MTGRPARQSSSRRLAAVLGLWLLLVLPAQAQIPFPLHDGLPSLAPVVERVTPAVVNIAVQSRVAVEMNPLLRDPFFRRFFELPERGPMPRRQSAGSGVIVDAARGLVLTNNHVVEGAERIMVTLKDQRTLDARLIGRDAGTDIALLRIDADGLVDIPLGDATRMRVGDIVMAVGNPFGLGQTVTSGIISAVGRSGLNPRGYEDFIQTDASINPGNSGGALVNLRGELIGIPTAIIGPSGGNIGIGFAVPSNMARQVMQQLLRYGEVRRGQLGVVVQDLTPELAGALGVDALDGAVIAEVGRDSPAERAGLRRGDVVVAMNDAPVRGSADLRNRVGLTPLGSTVDLTVLRDNRPRRVAVAIR